MARPHHIADYFIYKLASEALPLAYNDLGIRRANGLEISQNLSAYNVRCTASSSTVSSSKACLVGISVQNSGTTFISTSSRHSHCGIRNSSHASMIALKVCCSWFASSSPPPYLVCHIINCISIQQSCCP